MEPTFSYDMTDIATALGFRDLEIIKLQAQLKAAQAALAARQGETGETRGDQE